MGAWRGEGEGRYGGGEDWEWIAVVCGEGDAEVESGSDVGHEV